MPRTHPPTLLTLAKSTIRAPGGRGGPPPLVARGDTVVVAVSGGPDSMALLHVLALLRRDVGHRLVAHGVDHGLRPAAAAELDLAADFARTLDVPFDRTRVDVARGGNLQARARAARYAALDRAAARAAAAAVATAHHADDRAETVLIRLLRGAGPAGLAVLPPRVAGATSGAAAPSRSPSLSPSPPRAARIRPLLRATRADVERHVARHRVPFAVDPSNGDPRFLRARVRAELLPLLRELNPGIVAHLCALADQLGALQDPAIAADSPPFPASLPRATRAAIAAAARTRSPSARVRLPGDLVATYDRVQLGIIVSPRTPRARPSSDA